ncbi:MAG: MerR family transcriptional regulator [Nitrospiraceae bacterium]
MDENPRVPPSHEVWFTAAECAEKTRLTVRALRVYERHGLITPRRTAKNWRLYGVRELSRLNEIIILKQLGLPLSRIAQLLAKRAVDLAGILSMQATVLAGQRERLDRGLAMITGLHAKLEASGRLSLDDLIHLAKENTMSKTTEDAVAWKLYEQARPRTVVRLSRAILRQYAGHYRGGRGDSGTIDEVIFGIEPVGSLLELQFPARM